MTRVLIVDDKEDNLYYLRSLLTGHDCTVETARHGAEALVLARLSPPDLVVSDLLMPVMDGYTLLRHWKADPRLREVPFIVYTATYTEAEDERLAYSLGADAFILKPAEPEAFLARLREVLASVRSPDPRPPQQPSGDEVEVLKYYSETLIRKLEQKTLQLEEVNRFLQQDIAERRRTEDSLRESEERFRATFEQAAVGIAHVGTDGRFLWVNDRLGLITGHTRDELLAMAFFDLTMPEDRAEAEQARREMLAGTRPSYTVGKRYRRKDGGTCWINLVTTLLRGPAGEPKYFIAVFADITERKAMEERLLRAQRLESIGTLAGGIAHDLNNLLLPIMMGVDLLKQDPSAADTASVIATIEQSVQRGASLVQQVLSFARGVEGARVTVDLGALVTEIGAIVQGSFPKNIEFRPEVPPETWQVLGDPTQLHQVLLNLCVNARDAMPGGGTLGVQVKNVEIDSQYAGTQGGVAAGRHVRIKVTDTGCGMTKEIMDRIFEPFFTTKPPGKGTGFGLSTVLGIVRSHGGVVEVDSEPGRGSVFTVFLPAHLDVAPVPVPAPEAIPAGHGELVLVVDDDPTVLEITRATLENFGYRVVAAEDGARAMGLFAMHRGEVSAVIADLMMPVMDGAAFITAVRRLDDAVPVIAVSGLARNAERALAAGAQRFVAKPYTAATLLGALAAVLGGESTPAAPVPAGP